MAKQGRPPKKELIEDYWTDFIKDFVFNQPAFFISSAGRKYCQNIGFSIPGHAWKNGMDTDVNDLGYHGQTAKMNQLTRNYFNQDAITEAREKLTSRNDRDMDFTSVMVPTQAGPKRADSQGFCMTAIIISHLGKDSYNPTEKVTVEVLYRSTEITQKFGADLIFLHDIVLPAIIPPDIMDHLHSVSFHFANAFFSPLFTPVLYRLIDPIQFLEMLSVRVRDKREASMLRSCERAVSLPFTQTDPTYYNYRTRRIMHEVAIKAVQTGDINTERAKEYFAKRGLIL